MNFHGRKLVSTLYGETGKEGINNSSGEENR